MNERTDEWINVGWVHFLYEKKEEEVSYKYKTMVSYVNVQLWKLFKSCKFITNSIAVLPAIVQ